VGVAPLWNTEECIAVGNVLLGMGPLNHRSRTGAQQQHTMNDQPDRSRCADAVILIPGLMGSELQDARGRLLWGLRPRLLASALLTGRLFALLHYAPADGICARRLLRAPGLIPGLGNLDPYTRLARALSNDILVDSAALHEFAYDWRRSIKHSAQELERAAQAHLDAWRAHPKGSPDAKLWLVCHSLGGLVARYFTDVLGGREITHQILTLGTPHYGSVYALAALANGDVLKLGLHADRVRDLARALPSIYELCPRYACLTTGPHALRGRQFKALDLAAIGADPDLTTNATTVQDALSASTVDPVAACPVRALVGIAQPTAQTVTTSNGTIALHESIEGENRAGDGRVYRDSAVPIGFQPHELAQQHGRLASAPEAIDHVWAVLTGRPLGPPMGGDEIGIAVPAIVTAREPFIIRLVADPGRRVHCHATDADSGRPVGAAVIATTVDGDLTARLMLPRPGLYTIHAKAGGASPVAEHLLCTPPPSAGDP